VVGEPKLPAHILRCLGSLRDLVFAVLDARASPDIVERRLAEILGPYRCGAEIPDEELRKVLFLFVDELMTKHVFREKLPIRLECLAEIAWRAGSVAGPAFGTTIGLLSADALSKLDADPEALKLITLVEEDARATADPEHRLVQAKRVRYLLKAVRFEEAEAIVVAYDDDMTHCERDAIQLSFLMDGSRSASLLRQHSNAIRRAKEAVELFKSGAHARWNSEIEKLLVGPAPAAMVYCRLGDALRAALDHLSAIEAYLQGRARAFEDSDSRGAAFCLSEVGITWEHLSEFDRGRQVLDQAANEAERLGDHRAAARWRLKPVSDGVVTDVSGVNGIAAIAHELRTTGPSSEMEQTLKLIIKSDKLQGTTVPLVARNILAGVYRMQKRFGLARPTSLAAVATAEQANEHWLAMAFRSHLAQIQFESGYWEDAKSIAARILNDAEQHLANARTSEIRQAAMSASRYAADVLLLLDASDLNSESSVIPRDPLKVLHTVDRTRGRTFNRWLALVDWSRATNRADVQQATRSVISQDVAIEAAAHGIGMLEGLLKRREAAESSWKQLLQSLNLLQPSETSALVAQDIADCIPAGSVSVDLSAIEAGIVCLCIPKVGKPTVILIDWPRAQRKQWHAQLHAGWCNEAGALRKFSRDSSAAPGLVAIGEATADVAASMNAVYEQVCKLFFKPLCDWLPADAQHLIVTLHAELAFLPLWALAKVRPDVKISVLPTLQSIVTLAKRPAPQTGGVVAMGDATRTLRMADTECALIHDSEKIPPTVDALQHALPSAKRFHFAGHGEFDSDNPYLSGIVMSGAARSPYTVGIHYANCVRLTVAGVLDQMDAQNCELITISACSVGMPRSHAASEFTSVPTSFLIAGGRNVLASSWQVHDGATTVLMNHFYRALAATNSISAALARARDELKRTSREQAKSILGVADIIPDGEYPFSSPIFTDALTHYGLS
jgi:tetratricopeptide (TPR) repeat protein